MGMLLWWQGYRRQVIQHSMCPASLLLIQLSGCWPVSTYTLANLHSPNLQSGAAQGNSSQCGPQLWLHMRITLGAFKIYTLSECLQPHPRFFYFQEKIIQNDSFKTWFFSGWWNNSILKYIVLCCFSYVPKLLQWKNISFAIKKIAIKKNKEIEINSYIYGQFIVNKSEKVVQEWSFQQMMLGQLHIHKQKMKWDSLPHTIHKNDLKMDCSHERAKLQKS